MTKNIGYDEYWESGGAVEPRVAAENFVDFAETLTMEKQGGFWAPGGPRFVLRVSVSGDRLIQLVCRDVGQAERVLGKDLPTPLELPW